MKYFYNTRKQNHIRKHIRKLGSIGVITTNPYEILNMEKNIMRTLIKDWMSQNRILLPFVMRITLTRKKKEFGEGPTLY